MNPSRMRFTEAILWVVGATTLFAALIGFPGLSREAQATVMPVVDESTPLAETYIAIAQSPFGGGAKPMAARVALVAPVFDESGSGDVVWKEVDSFEDPRSFVFHKAMPFESADGKKGILTIAGTEARLILWTRGEKAWEPTDLWTGTFGGSPRSQRMRDVEVGDVDGDGADEIVVVTHDRGVVFVFEQEKGTFVPNEIDRTEDPTWIHEVELGDINGDGVIEIVCTPSAPNQMDGKHQGGEIVMYRHSGHGTFERTLLEDLESRHAKEILIHDLDRDGTPELYAAFEGEGIGGVGGASCSVHHFRFEGGEVSREKIYDLPVSYTTFMKRREERI